MPNPQFITNCRKERKRLVPLQPSIDDAQAGAESSDYDEDDPRQEEWPHNIISTKTVAYSCGIIARAGDSVAHKHDPAEIARCRRLAEEAAGQLRGAKCLGGRPDSRYLPFCITACVGEPVPRKLTDKVIRTAFRRTIYPDTPIILKPLRAEGPFWELIEGDYWSGQAEAPPYFAAFQRCIEWFGAQKELRGASYVEIGYDTAQEPNLAAVFPRLVLALTKAGSLVGVCGCIVQA